MSAEWFRRYPFFILGVVMPAFFYFLFKFLNLQPEYQAGGASGAAHWMLYIVFLPYDGLIWLVSRAFMKIPNMTLQGRELNVAIHMSYGALCLALDWLVNWYIGRSDRTGMHEDSPEE